VWWEGKARRAATVAFALANDRWPKATVKAACGNLACCRPEHLVEAQPPGTARAPAKGTAAPRARPPVVPQRLAHGRGSLRELRPGVWELRLPVRASVWPAPPGVSRMFEGARADAEEALAELAEQARHGGPLRVDPTFAELVDSYVRWYGREADAGVPGAVPLVSTARSLATDSAQALGELRLSALADGRAIEDWEHALLDAERPVHEVAELHAALVRVLGWGVAHGWVRRLRDPRPFLGRSG
jgi:hypothetical protein